MNWLLKVAGHWSASAVGPEWYYLLQKRYGSLFMREDMLDDVLRDVGRHLESFTHRTLQFGEGLYFEFGVGWDLLVPLILWSMGVKHQLLIDISRLARVELINRATMQLRRRAFEVFGPIEHLCELEEHGIRYIAPANASDLRALIGDNQVRYISSTNVLEHVPKERIRAILRECHRIMTDDGIMSLKIDYQDHYAYSDPHISRVNFLRFSERAWKWLNPPTHYQNRLRHREYLKIIHESGFVIKKEECFQRDDILSNNLGWISDNYAREDLITTGSHLALAKLRV